MAAEAGFDEVKRGQVELIVTELARNIVNHGKGGHLLLAGWQNRDSNWIDIIAVDKGSGIPNLSAALEDGFSSSGTPGTGMGAVSRTANVFEVFTHSKHGTGVLARVSQQERARPTLHTGAVSIPITGERVCGDAFASNASPGRSIFMVVDGLGHGPIAAEAATGALEAFEKYCSDPPAEIIERIHGAIKSSRGAAVAVAEVQHDRGVVVYCGVGNIAGVIFMPTQNVTRSMVSHNGIVGHQMPRVAEFQYPWSPEATLIMHSDGVSGRWDLTSYPGLVNKDPALVAGVIYRDYNRTRDDATVLVARQLEQRTNAS